MFSRGVSRLTRRHLSVATRSQSRQGSVAQWRASPSVPVHWVRAFSSNRGNEDFADLLKKMQGDDRKEEEGGQKPEGANGEPSFGANDGEHTEEVSAGDAYTEQGEKHEGDETGDRVQEDDEDDKEKEDKEGQGASFEMPKFDPEEAKAFAASLPSRFGSFKDSFILNVREAFAELKGENRKSGLRAKVQQAESYRRAADMQKDEGEGEEEQEEEEAREKGPSALVHVKDPVSQWDVMKQRLADAPLIREILRGSKKAYNVAADTDLGHKAEDMADRMKEKVEDAKEFWETSQNPLVYTLSGVWDNMTGETEEGICIAEILKLDPGFDKESWAEEVRTNLVPHVIKAHLTGDKEFLGEHLGEGVLNKLTQDIKLREDDRIEFDSNILDIDENVVQMKYMEDNGPVIVCVYMVQQINCIRKGKDREIIEGGEAQVVAKFYSIAFTQEYLEDDGEVRWKIVDYEFGGETPYL